MDNTTKQDLKAEIKELKDDINESGQKYLELQIKNKKLRDDIKLACSFIKSGEVPKLTLGINMLEKVSEDGE